MDVPAEPSGPFTVTVNGRSQPVPQGTTVRGLLDRLGIQGPAAVERNGAIVLRARHATEALADGDTLEIVHFVGGG